MSVKLILVILFLIVCVVILIVDILLFISSVAVDLFVNGLLKDYDEERAD